jgi:hypothetical protein
MSESVEDVPELVIGDQETAVVDLLRELQRAALVHPEATRALFNALASEGRSFAQTSEGKRLKERILASTLLQRAALVWQNATLWITEDPERYVTPSALVDAVAAAASSSRRDVLLDTLFRSAERSE